MFVVFVVFVVFFLRQLKTKSCLPKVMCNREATWVPREPRDTPPPWLARFLSMVLGGHTCLYMYTLISKVKLYSWKDTGEPCKVSEVYSPACQSVMGSLPVLGIPDSILSQVKCQNS